MAAAISESVGAPLDRPGQQVLAKELVRQARSQGTDLKGPEGQLAGWRRVLETALETEMAAYLGFEAHHPAGRNRSNSRNGRPSKTVLTGPGPVEIAVPRDREAICEPVIVKQRQRRTCPLILSVDRSQEKRLG